MSVVDLELADSNFYVVGSLGRQCMHQVSVLLRRAHEHIIGTRVGHLTLFLVFLATTAKAAESGLLRIIAYGKQLLHLGEVIVRYE